MAQPNAAPLPYSGGGSRTPYGPVSVLGRQYTAPHVVVLTIDETGVSLTGVDYTVTNANGNGTVFFVKGAVFSLHKHLTLTDADGNVIVTMSASIASAHNRWSVYRGPSADARDLLFQFTKELHVFLKANDGEADWDFQVDGSVKSCTIRERRTNSVIARMHSKSKLSNLIGKDLLVVTIEPNVDQAFVTVLIVLLDEISEAFKAFNVLDAGTLLV